MNATIRLLTAAALGLACGCNHRDSLFDTPSPTAPNLLSSPRPAVSSLAFEPSALLGQSVTVRGRVALTFTAPAGGLAVSLSSGDPGLVSVPSTVTVPANSDTAEFQATAQAVSSDRDVTVTATSGTERPATATMSLWTIVPTFFSFWSQPGDYIGRGGVRRLTPPFQTFLAFCEDNKVRINYSTGVDQFWSATFQAPKGLPLRVGTYEGAAAWPFQGDSEPGLDISGEGQGCNRLTGRFVVREADFTASGQVRHFWATFEQHCEGQAPALFGDARVTDAPQVSGVTTCRQ